MDYKTVQNTYIFVQLLVVAEMLELLQIFGIYYYIMLMVVTLL